MADVGSVAPSGLNFTGLATGIDTSKLIDGLLAPGKAGRGMEYGAGNTIKHPGFQARQRRNGYVGTA